MPRLLVLSERVPPQRGGVAVATGRICGHARDAGWSVDVVHVSRDLEPGARGHRSREGLTLHPVGASGDEEETLRAWYTHAAALADQASPDLVHGIYATRAGYLATLLAAERGVPSVVSLRGNDLDRGLFRPRELPFLQHALTRATVVTGVSAALATTAAAFADRPVRHVTNAVDAERFVPKGADNTLRTALGLGDATVLGFLGELRDKKGMRYLLPALDALVRAGRNVRLLLIGGVRAEMQDHFRRFEEMAPEAFARTHVVGYVRDPGRLSGLLGLCELMVFPSLYDGTPNAVLEAMACSRAILASDAGGQRDLIEHGETGALLPVGDLDRLPEAIEEMLDLPSRTRRDFARAARARVLEAHRPEQERDAYQAVYAEARAAMPEGTRSA